MFHKFIVHTQPYRKLIIFNYYKESELNWNTTIYNDFFCNIYLTLIYFNESTQFLLTRLHLFLCQNFFYCVIAIIHINNIFKSLIYIFVYFGLIILSTYSLLCRYCLLFVVDFTVYYYIKLH